MPWIIIIQSIIVVRDDRVKQFPASDMHYVLILEKGYYNTYLYFDLGSHWFAMFPTIRSLITHYIYRVSCVQEVLIESSRDNASVAGFDLQQHTYSVRR